MPFTFSRFPQETWWPTRRMFKQNSPDTYNYTPQKLRKLEQELELEWGRKGEEGDWLECLYLWLSRLVRDPGPFLGHRMGQENLPVTGAGRQRHTTRALCSSISSRLSLLGLRSGVQSGFPRVEERSKARNAEPFSSSSHRTRWGSEPHTIRMEGLWQKQA